MNDVQRTAVALVKAAHHGDLGAFVDLWNGTPEKDRGVVVQALAAIPLGLLQMIGTDPDAWLDHTLHGLALPDDDEGAAP